jgi:hypothetical protein
MLTQNDLPQLEQEINNKTQIIQDLQAKLTLFDEEKAKIQHDKTIMF